MTNRLIFVAIQQRVIGELNVANHRLFSIISILLLVFFLTGFNSADTPVSGGLAKSVITLDDGAKLQKTKCWFELPKQNNQNNIECAWLSTAPAAGSTKSAFKLPIVIFHYTGDNRKSDPIIYLAGGPGSGAWLDDELIHTFWLNQWNEHLAELKRDLILFDQRGSGLSLPKIECPEYKEHAKKLLVNPEPPKKTAEQYYHIAESCVQQLKSKGIAIEQLSTYYSAIDVNDIMQALNYDKWNIQSVSYGTRLGIEVQRRYPDKVRTMLLDSVYPPSAHLFEDWPILLNASLERIFRYCEIDPACSISHDDFYKRFWRLMDRLHVDPLAIEVSDPKLGVDHIILNDETLLAVLFQAEYRTNIISYLTEALFELERNDTHGIQPFVDDYIATQFDESSNDAVYWAVECHDNMPFDNNRFLAYKKKFPRLAYYLEEDHNVCKIWNRDYQHVALMPPNTDQESTTPVLIFSGEDDPITPSSWAIDSASSFGNNTYLFSFYGVSHSVLDNKNCAPILYNHFVNSPFKRPRADCRIDDEENNIEPQIAKESSVEEQEEEHSDSDEFIAVNNNTKRLPN